MILFVGDPHGDFTAVREHGRDAEHIVLLGDQTPAQALEAELGSLASRTWWIFGNHDGDKPEFLERHMNMMDRNLHGRVVTLDGLRVAGLAGVFRQKVWSVTNDQPLADAMKRSSRDGMTRRQFTESTRPAHRFQGGPAPKHWTSIFPDDVERLAKLEADVLVTHEAPESHRHGFKIIGDLAKAMGARLVVHGHHHPPGSFSHESVIEGGIKVQWLTEREAWPLSTAVAHHL